LIVADTNFLIRILVDDETHAREVLRARQVAQKAKEVYVPQLVIVEVARILQDTYALGKNELIATLDHMARNNAYVIQRETQFLEALNLFTRQNVSFSSCMALVESKLIKSTLMTFDYQMSRLDGAALVR